MDLKTIQAAACFRSFTVLKTEYCRFTGHSLESSISADTHIPARRARYLRLSSATLKKCCGTCARSQLQCLRYYHGPDFF